MPGKKIKKLIVARLSEHAARPPPSPLHPPKKEQMKSMYFSYIL